MALIAGLLREARGREVELAALYLTGVLPQGRIGLGWRTLQPAVASGPAVGEPLTLSAVDGALAAVAAETGLGSAERRLGRLRALFGRAEDEGRALLVELLTGELRQGALEGLVTEAIAKAAGLPPADVRRAAMYAGNLGELARAALEDGAASLSPLLAAAPLSGRADAGQPRGRRRGGARSHGRGRVRVQARRGAAAGAPRRRRGARVHAAAAGRDRTRAGGGRVGTPAARARGGRRGRGPGAASRRATAAVPGDDAPARSQPRRRVRPRAAAALPVLLRSPAPRGRGSSRLAALRGARPTACSGSSLRNACCPGS